jgi:hypothetical protein
MATVLTSAGEAWVIDKLDNTVVTTGKYISWGTGAGTADKADTTLFTEATESRVEATITQPAADKIQWVATMTCNLTGKTITNAGNFVATSGGSPIVHGDFTGVPVTSGDTIQFTITLEIT